MKAVLMRSRSTRFVGLLLLCWGAAACNNVDYFGDDGQSNLVGDDDVFGPTPTPTPTDAPTPTPPACDAANDIDGDGFCPPTDCDDFNLNVNPGMAESCNSARDDDCDGAIDCDDADCAGDALCDSTNAEICDNIIDDDNDGFADCADPDCSNDPNCQTGPGTETSCVNNIDDDNDGLVDCNDPDCTNDPACAPPGPGACNGSNLLADGDFEGLGTGWNQYSQNGWSLIFDSASSPVAAQAGSYLAWLGGDDNELSYVEQEVTLPAGANNIFLSYWWAMTTSEWGLGAYDFAGILVTDTGGNTLSTLLNLDNFDDTGGSWYNEIHSLTSYAGQTVRVHWGIDTDGSDPTSLFVDNISLTCN